MYLLERMPEIASFDTKRMHAHMLKSHFVPPPHQTRGQLLFNLTFIDITPWYVTTYNNIALFLN